MNGWGPEHRGGMELPTVTSALVTVNQFPQYMQEKNDNGSKALRNEYLVSMSVGLCVSWFSFSLCISYMKRYIYYMTLYVVLNT